jgi:hypothetical protein
MGQFEDSLAEFHQHHNRKPKTGVKYQNETLNEREASHGDFANTAQVSGEIKGAITRGFRRAGKDTSGAVCMESLHMIATKMARLASGDHKDIDTWRDIAGYADLAREQLERESLTNAGD